VGLVLAALGILVMAAPAALGARFWDGLQPEQTVGRLRVVNLYEGAGGDAMGGRFVSDRYGFIVDVLEIESVPQAFFWIKTPPTSDKGEPHTCEHLLLGKGNRGRYVSVLEDVSLGSSSAYTGQLRTCYHFNTVAGQETFRRLFEAKLMALLHPDFTDEEIRREVRHVGVETDPKTGELFLEEKGTVYTEMISSFEKPWYYHSSAMWDLVYGDGHPISNVSGGSPAALRTLMPDDIRQFHRDTHRLGNMGTIVALPSTADPQSFLEWLDGTLDRCQAAPTQRAARGIGSHELPPPEPESVGTVKMVSFPSDDPDDPGSVHFCWPAQLELGGLDRFLMGLFVDAFANGHASRMYRLLVDSTTRRVDLGIKEVWGWAPEYPGSPVWISLDGLDPAVVSHETVERIRALVLQEIDRICRFEDGSEELAEFNRDVLSRLVRDRKTCREHLDSPPMFGHRSGSAGWWVSHLEVLERVDGFSKSLVLEDYHGRVSQMLASGSNVWTALVDRWRLRDTPPYGVGSVPEPALLENMRREKEARLEAWAASLCARYAIDSRQEALARYQKEFDGATALMDAVASEVELPGFTLDPPLTLDDHLNYEVGSLPGGVPFVASTFPHMTSSTIGVAFRLDVVPESLLVYMPLLPDVLTSIGVVKDGDVVPYDEMEKRLREEVLRYGARFDHGYDAGRIELILEGAGGDARELGQVLTWMEASLYSPSLGSGNLPRMYDLIDQRLLSLRNTTRRPEEAWVDGPASAYRFQANPLFLSTGCFLTSVHHLQRLRFLLAEAGEQAEQDEIVPFLDSLTAEGQGRDRKALEALLSSTEQAMEDGSTPDADDRLPALPSTEVSVANAKLVVAALKVSLPDIPDASLGRDWQYLCGQIKADLLTPPDEALGALRGVLDLLLKADNARMYLVSRADDRAVAWEQIERFAALMDAEHVSLRQAYDGRARIVERLSGRVPDVAEPLYVGLVHEGTTNGVLLNSAEYAGAPYDTSTSAVLDCLAGRLFGGGGPHSLFMRTWSAGLAYSNGFSVDEARGRVGYYAERCPDVAQTMSFVVNELRKAEDNPALADYAVAQAFRRTRAASRYESRGRAMAADLADGYTPERVAAFRSRVLEIREAEGLYQNLRNRMENVYGRVLVGYGPPLLESTGRCFFLIGPESQFQSYEAYIAANEGPQPVYRLYPRDFWLVP
jgi:Zn-dependent M16 (insulinase) family peptidase